MSLFAFNDFELYKGNYSGLHNDYEYRGMQLPLHILHWTFALSFECVNDYVEKTLAFQQNWQHSFTISVVYFLLIKLVQRMMRNQKPFNLRIPLVVWNGILSVFSILGFIRFSEDLIHSLIYKGLYPSLCYSVKPDGVAAFWSTLFAASKVAELGDTLFIVLRKKPLIFLHYYHHAAVLVYTAHSGAEHTGSGRMFISMNFLVHSAMYLYYTLTSYGIRPAKWISMCITSLQTIQMFLGIIVSLYVYRIKLEGKLPCQQSMKNLALAFIIYVTFAALFVHFFIKSYIRKNKIRQKKAD
ncbi:unnamed protein product [Dracunculus medinensis]|uniref:Elongation of very long chain fatty acids protein n=1 Tax=Dracunculus medinensis TaxID=318479 RepID=A0A0N4UG16_DRAME|nr:unnamed protein product [Dracunculus medinensis]